MSGPRKKSLAEELLEFTNPAPKELDPEGAVNDWDALEMDGAGEMDESASTPSAKYQKAEVRRTMKAEPIMGPKYRGKKTTRKEALRAVSAARPAGDSDDDQLADGQVEAPLPDISSSDEEMDDQGDGPELDIQFDDDQVLPANGNDSSDDDMYSGMEGGPDSEHSGLKHATEEADDLEAELSDSQSAGEAPSAESSEEDDKDETVERLRESNKAELDKSVGAMNQKVILDSLLDFRIKLQPALDLANRLPQAPIFSDFVRHNLAEQTDIDEKLSSVKEEIRQLLNETLQLQEALRSNNKEVNAYVDIARKKRGRAEITGGDSLLGQTKDIDDLWDSLTAELTLCNSYQTTTIDKWNAKTLYASGLSMPKLKALNQSISQQVENALTTNRTKIFKRTQLRRDNSMSLGKRRKVDEERSKAVTETEEEQYDSEIFDDGDFFTGLLKELASSGLQDTTDPIEMSRQWLKIRQSQQKKQHRPNVDRRATKGRRLKYNEQPKLVSYMAPQPFKYPNSGSFFAQQLAASLFNKIN